MRPLSARVASAAVAIALAAQLAGGRADADECASDPHTCAVTYFEAGRKLLEAGAWSAAAPIFNKSLESQPTIGAYLNLGDCDVKLNAPWEAYTMYAAAERLATETRDPRRAAADSSAAAIAGRVLRVRVRGEGPGSTIRIDDAKVPDALLPLLESGRFALDASKSHRIDVTAAGAKPFTASVAGPAGTEKVVDVVQTGTSPLPPAPPPGPSAVPAPAPSAAPGGPAHEPPRPAPAGPRASESGGAMRGAAIGIGAVGIGGVIAGTVAGVIALGKKSDLDKLCTSYPTGCDPTQKPTIVSDNDAAQTAQWVSTIGLIAGGVAVATGVVLYLVAPRATLTVSPTVGGAGLSFAKAW